MTGSGGGGRTWRTAALFTVFVLLPTVWVALTPPFTTPHNPAIRTRARLTLDNRVLHAYLDKYKKIPADLNTLRTFAYVDKLRFEAYDAYGQRFDYLRLDDRHYLLRSFGEDQLQNTVHSPPDMGVVRWGPRPPKTLTYRYPDGIEPDLYPVALLPGADSPDKQWLARLFVDPENRTRQLLIRHRTKTGLFMVASHDAVEEFFWLPNSHQIVFTATASARYRDGLFLWNLADDSLVNLLDAAAGNLPMSPAKGGANLWLALAGVTKSGVVTVWQHQRHDGGLDPAEFFNKSQLLALAVPEKSGAPVKLLPAAALPKAADLSPLSRPLDPASRLEGTGGLKIQHLWLQLPTQGDLEQVLLEWHQISDKATGSPLFPYSLWLLSGLYAESSQVMTPLDAHSAEVLRTFGTEITRALLNYPLAPSYLRGLALFGYENLMEGQPLPYRFAKLTPAAGKVQLPAAAPAK